MLTLIAILLSNILLTSAGNCWRDIECTGPTIAAFPGDWDKFNYAPASRTTSPVSILSQNGTPISQYPGIAILRGNDDQLVFDFGKEVGGIVTVTYSAQGTGSLGLAFTESKNWIGEQSDHSTGWFQPEGALYAQVMTTQSGSYTMPDVKLRGGFRYLTLFSKCTGDITINIQSITVELSFQPAWSNLRAYKGYFSCSDDLLTKIWYSGAYTLQTNAVPPNTGRRWPMSDPSSWTNDASFGGAIHDTAYVDGSKRDRTIWPGDLAIAVPATMLSTGDWDGIRQTLNAIYDQQLNGVLPFAGPPINLHNSDTYHMATLMGTYEYFIFTGDKSWLNSIYATKFKPAMDFITAKIDSTGLLFVTLVEDWGRVGQGGRNTEANMIMYETLVRGSKLAGWSNDQYSSSKWAGMAATLKLAVNNMNWHQAGAFKDNDGSTDLLPQDGNSMALAFSVADPSRMQSISTSLTRNWNQFGAVAPELPDNIIGFVQSFEIKGHMVARQASRALDLIRRSWGWYLNNPLGTASTCIEGYKSDGTFGYRANSPNGYQGDISYTSHAHGWSTGPTEVLTKYIAGLQVTSPAGKTWQLSPQFGDLTHAEAGFTTPLGKFKAGWKLVPGGYTITWNAPSNTVGTFILPGREGQQPILTTDNRSRMLLREYYNETTNLLNFEMAGAGCRHTLTVKL